jgi:hypothetical protein
MQPVSLVTITPTTSVPASTASSQPSSGISSGAVAGIVVGSVLGTACLAGVGFFFLRRPQMVGKVSDVEPIPAAPSEGRTFDKEVVPEPETLASGRLRYPE